MMQLTVVLRLCQLCALLAFFAGVNASPSLELMSQCRHDAIRECNFKLFAMLSSRHQTMLNQQSFKCMCRCGSHLEEVTLSQLDACYVFENDLLTSSFQKCAKCAVVKSTKENSLRLFLNTTYADSWRRASAQDPPYFSCMQDCAKHNFAKCSESGYNNAIHDWSNPGLADYKCLQGAHERTAHHFLWCIRGIWSFDVLLTSEEIGTLDRHRAKRKAKNIIDYKRYNVIKKIPQAQLKKLRASPPRFSGPLKEYVDWRKINPPVLSPVKNQENCGSCWAFASAAVLEAQLVITEKHLENGGAGNISAQQFVDCVNKWKGMDKTRDPTCPEQYKGEDNGCCGGHAHEAWEFSHEHAVVWESNYNYIGRYSPNACQWQKFKDTRVAFRPLRNPNTVYVHVQDKKAMMEAVSFVGPIVATLNGNCLPDMDQSFHFNRVLNNKDNTDSASGAPCDISNINHVVVIVGYGTTADKSVPYWIIRNSWGPKWGQGGYARVKRGTKELGIEVEGGFYPLLKK